MRSLADQVVIITGASSGLGEASARRLARSGAKLVISARRAERLEALARELEEELGIGGAAGRVITRYLFTYPGRDTIELIFFRVSSFTGEPKNLIFEELRWQPRLQLRELDFVEGDREFLEGIYTGAYGNSD